MPSTEMDMSGGKVGLGRMMSNPGLDAQCGILARYADQISDPEL